MAKYQLSNIDMTEFYKKLTRWYSEWPAVLVMDELENGGDILKHRLENGAEVIHLRRSENMLEVLEKEFDQPLFEWSEAISLENHKLSNKEVMAWQSTAWVLAELLDIPCPQIVFSSDVAAKGQSLVSEGLILMPDFTFEEFDQALLELAGDLRYCWQIKNKPEWIVRSKSEDADLYDDFNIDKEAFSVMVIEAVLNAPIAFSDERFGETCREYMEEMDVEIDEDSLELIRSFLPLE